VTKFWVDSGSVKAWLAAQEHPLRRGYSGGF